MKHRQFKALASQADAQLFPIVSEGLRLIAQNAARLCEDAEHLENSGRSLSAAHLENSAREEFGKFLVLLDSVRCPRASQQVLSEHLAKCSNHLAKGFYADICDLNFSSLEEVERYASTRLRSHFLDGPTGADWTFRNDIIARREDGMYVDFVEVDGEYRWSNPTPTTLQRTLSSPPVVLSLVNAFLSSGFTSSAALKVVAQKWRAIQPATCKSRFELDEHNQDTLDLLDAAGLLQGTPQEWTLIARNWQFPLYTLPLREIPRSTSDLEAEREGWTCD